MEKVSVIVPVYNGENSIKRCADSILNQDYPDLELLLVDDGSRDRSWEIMQAIAAADHRVKAIHQENGGRRGSQSKGDSSGKRGCILRAQPGPCRGERNICAVRGCG